MGLRIPSRAWKRQLAYVVLSVVLLSAAPFVSRWHLQTTAVFHTLLETICSELALITGCMALVRYYTKKDAPFLILGSGFLGAALHDAYHAVVASSMLTSMSHAALGNHAGWSGVAHAGKHRRGNHGVIRVMECGAQESAAEDQEWRIFFGVV